MPRLPDCRIVGKELTFVFPSNGDALVGYRMIRDAVEAAEKATPKPALQLRVGGKYLDRAGRVKTVDKIDREGPYPIRTCGINGTFDYFTAEGLYFDREAWSYDLIEEVALPISAKPALTFHVGGKYRDREGRVWTVAKTDGGGVYSVRAIRDSGLIRIFTAEGRHVAWKEDAFDLIEEIAPPPCPTIHDCKAGQTERCTCCDKEDGE